MPDRVLPVRSYVLVCAALLLLTGLTILLAHIDLHGLNAALALAIAAAKAVLIALFFMHLRSSPSTTRIAALAGLFWLAILISGTMDDLITRGWLPTPGK